MKRWLSHIILLCLCLSILLLASCDKLPDEIKDIIGKVEPDQPIEEHVHTLVKHEGLAPTCTEAGYLPYETCSECDEYTTYEALPALGHSFSDEFLPSGDHHSRFCLRCTESVDEEHAWQASDMIVEPTCLLGGTQSYVCTVCGVMKVEDVQALGHDYTDVFTENGEYHSCYCSRCDSTVDEAHEWVEGDVITVPTCTTDGLMGYYCSVCAKSKEETLAHLGHDYSENYAPNADVHSLFCSRCDSTVDGAHEWTKSSTLTVPTCTEEGLDEYLCSICFAKKQETVSSLGHDYSEKYTNVGDTHTRLCSRCDDVTDTANHSWQAGDITVAPTCVDSGLQTYFCTACDATETRTLAATGEHIDGGWEVIYMPTATVRGKEQLRCAVCNNVIFDREIACDADSMPVLNFTGDYTAATNAKNEVPMQFSFVDPNGTTIEGYAKIKVQGSSSVAYPKKNYTVKLYKDSEFDSKYKVDLGWGKENKYVIKANWVDFSSARNVVSCRLWGDIVQSRATSDIQQRLAGLKTNGGAIDGFAVAVYMNGTFHGLYTFNVPKDEWMFDMGDSETEAILGADDWNHTDFNTLIGSFYEDGSGDIVSKEGGWELIYCGSDDYSWVAPSFDALIKFCQENDGEAFRAGISEYLDVDAAIDYIIYMYAVCMRDNASKNMLWITYDGKVWTPSVYDQDGTFGQSWDGVNAASTGYCLPKVSNGKVNPNIPFGPNAHPVNFILWDRILNCFTEEVLLRYKYLRETTLSVENIKAELKAFQDSVPASIYEADRIKWAADRETWWAGKKGSGVWYEKFNFDYMYTWVENRMISYDAVMQDIYNNVYLPKTDSPAL